MLRSLATSKTHFQKSTKIYAFRATVPTFKISLCKERVEFFHARTILLSQVFRPAFTNFIEITER